MDKNRKHRVVVQAIAAGIIFLLAVGIYSYISIWNARQREHEQRLVAEEETYLSQVNLAQAYIAESDCARADDVLWRTDPQRRRWEWGYLLNRANPDVFTVETPGLSIHGAFFTPDGKKIVTLSTLALTPVWDAETGQALATLEGEPMYYTGYSFSPDSSKVAVSGFEGVAVWDIASGKRLLHFPLASGAYSVAFDENGSRLFAGGGDKTIRIWDVASGSLVREVVTETNPVYALKLHPDKQRMVAGLGNPGSGKVQIWSLADFQPLFSVDGLTPCLSPDGALLAVADGSDIVLCASDTGSPSRRMHSDQGLVQDFQFNRDGSRLLSAGENGTVQLWDTTGEEKLRTFQCRDPVRHAFFIENGRFVLTCTRAKSLSLWLAEGGDAPLYAVRARGPGLMMADLAPDGQRLALATTDQFFQVWNVSGPTGVQLAAYHVPQEPQNTAVLALNVSESKNCFAVAWQDGVFSIFDTGITSASTHYLCPPPFTSGGRMAPDPDGHRVLTLMDPFTPVVWDVDASSLLYAYREHDDQITAVAWSPDGRRIASGGTEGSVRVWDAPSGGTERVIEGHSGAVWGTVFSPDSAAILTGSADKTAVLWAVDTGGRLATFEHAFPVLDVAFSGRGDRIAAATSDAKVHVWDVKRGVELGVLETNAYCPDIKSSRLVVSFTPDDQYILTSGDTINTRLWDAASYREVAAFETNELVELLPDGRSAIGVDANGVIRRIETAPWSQDQWPGQAGLEWQDRYREYRLKQSQGGQAIRRVPEEDTFLVPLSTETLAEAFKALLEELATPNAEAPTSSEAASWEKGLPIVSGPHFWSTFRLGLRLGDCVTHVNGKPLATRVDALNCLEDAVRTLAGSQTARAEIAISRSDRTIQYKYRALPVHRRAVAITLSRAAAMRLLDQEIAITPSCETARRYSPPGITYLVATLSGTQDPQGFKAGGLLIDDVIAEIDGRRFSEYEPLKQYLSQLKHGIESGETVRFSHHVLRGILREMDITYTVSPEASP